MATVFAPFRWCMDVDVWAFRVPGCGADVKQDVVGSIEVGEVEPFEFGVRRAPLRTRGKVLNVGLPGSASICSRFADAVEDVIEFFDDLEWPVPFGGPFFGSLALDISGAGPMIEDIIARCQAQGLLVTIK